MLIPRTTAVSLMRRDDDPDTPPSPFSFSYFVPLLLVILACGGFVIYRRSRRRGESGIPLSFPASQQPGIRLSEDGPPTHTFTHDNASSDSLPSHALEDLPDLNKLQRPPLPTIYSSSTSTSTSEENHNSTLPSTGLTKAGYGNGASSNMNFNGSGFTSLGRGGIVGSTGGRRSMKARQGQTAVEPSDSEGEDAGTTGQNGNPFGIGDEDDSDDDHSDGDVDGDLGPLGRTGR
ncbi:hypothetical protein IAT40_002412 [Kwoniella sp. CBS 6097]